MQYRKTDNKSEFIYGNLTICPTFFQNNRQRFTVIPITTVGGFLVLITLVFSQFVNMHSGYIHVNFGNVIHPLLFLKQLSPHVAHAICL